jgi:endonuclease YncB( thermonuclease family)
VAAKLHGRVHVIDGDTIVVGGIHVRLQGIAAPEVPHHGKLGEAGGAEARDYLEALAEGRIAVCDLTGERTHSREVGVCRVGGRDVAEQVIAAGLARDCPRYSKGRYAAAEPAAAHLLPFPAYCVPRR